MYEALFENTILLLPFSFKFLWLHIVAVLSEKPTYLLYGVKHSLKPNESSSEPLHCKTTLIGGP